MAPSHSSTISRAGNAAVINRSAMMPLFACIAIALALSIFFVWTRQRVLNLEYEISSLESGIRSGRQETNKLQLENAMLRQSSRIEALARDQFGLTMPDSRQMIVIR